MSRKKKELSATDQVLETSKGKFETVLLIGLDKKGNIDVSSSSNSFIVLHWLLNRAGFELLIHEKNLTAKANEDET